ncbi:addiction module protein [Luteimonas changyuni]
MPADDPAAVPLTSVQLQEIQARLDAHERDPSSAVSWEQLRSELFQP